MAMLGWALNLGFAGGGSLATTRTIDAGIPIDLVMAQGLGKTIVPEPGETITIKMTTDIEPTKLSSIRGGTLLSYQAVGIREHLDPGEPDERLGQKVGAVPDELDMM